MDTHGLSVLLGASVFSALMVASGGSSLDGETLVPGGLTYVWWRFNVAEFEDFQIDITIHNDLEQPT